MAAAKKKSKTNKKSARVTAKPKAAARAAKTASSSAARKKTGTSKIDPLNRKVYRSVTPMLAVSDVRRAIDFYTSALGFTVRSVMDTPQGVLHAELVLRDTTLMLSPEDRRQNSLSANAIGNTPLTLYLLVEDVDDVFASAIATGGRAVSPVMDMFWGDRCGILTDPDGNKWMISTHKSEPTEVQMAEAMRQMRENPPESAASAGAGSTNRY